MFKYIGNGAFLPGVPARDLSDKEAKEMGEKKLLAAKLYKKPTGNLARNSHLKGQKAGQGSTENKLARGGAENKEVTTNGN